LPASFLVAICGGSAKRHQRCSGRDHTRRHPSRRDGWHDRPVATLLYWTGAARRRITFSPCVAGRAPPACISTPLSPALPQRRHNSGCADAGERSKWGGSDLHRCRRPADRPAPGRPDQRAACPSLAIVSNASNEYLGSLSVKLPQGADTTLCGFPCANASILASVVAMIRSSAASVL